MPDIMYATSEIRKDIELPGLFQINNGYLMMTEPFAEIVQRFRIGSTQISPVNFYDLELDEPVNDRHYYFLNVCEWHSYFLPEAGGKELERTQRRSWSKDGYPVYSTPYDKNEEKLYFFSKAALDAPVDLWHDPYLDESIFMSDALVDALKAEGFGSCLSLASCKLLDPS